MTAKDKKKAYGKAYHLANRDKRKAYSKMYYETHKEKEKIRKRARRLAHPDKVKAEEKAYRLSHKEDRKTYFSIHKEKIKVQQSRYNKVYSQKHRQERAANGRKRRALKRGNSHEPYTGSYIFERDGWICQLCGQKINRRLKWPNPRSMSIDHIIPLIKGGSDAPSNVQAAHLRCNLGKHATNKGQLRLFG